MSIDFDTRMTRIGTHSVKWDARETLFGSEDVLPMWVADMDFLSPKPVVEALVNRAQHGIYGYPHTLKAVKGTVENWMGMRHNWAVDQSWLLYSPSVLTTLSVAVETLTKPGDGVVIQPPVYPPFRQLVTRLERTVIENPLKNVSGHYEMDLDDLREKLQETRAKVLILCSPHNPVGRVWTRTELESLRDVCRSFGVTVLSDEIHGDLVYSGSRHTPFASLEGAADMTVTCTAPTKTFNLAGLHFSTAIIASEGLRNQISKRLESLWLTNANIMAITAVEAAYTEGQEWLDELLRYLETNVQVTCEFVQSRLPLIRTVKPEGTYLMWLDCRALGLDGKALERHFSKIAKVGVNQGYTFGTTGEGFVRLNVACPRSLLLEGLQRIENSLEAIERETR